MDSKNLLIISETFNRLQSYHIFHKFGLVRKIIKKS